MILISYDLGVDFERARFDVRDLLKLCRYTVNPFFEFAPRRKVRYGEE